MILDTCALLWLATGDDRLGGDAREAIDAAVVVHVPAICGFEIGIKVARGKLRLPLPPADWFAAVLAHHRLAVLPLELDVAVRATVLPPVHRDPCDRFIAAAALVHDLPVATADPVFARYGVRVIDCG